MQKNARQSQKKKCDEKCAYNKRYFNLISFVNPFSQIIQAMELKNQLCT